MKLHVTYSIAEALDELREKIQDKASLTLDDDITVDIVVDKPEPVIQRIRGTQLSQRAYAVLGHNREMVQAVKHIREVSETYVGLADAKIYVERCMTNFPKLTNGEIASTTTNVHPLPFHYTP